MSQSLLFSVLLLLAITALTLGLLYILERAKRGPGQAAILAARQQQAVWAGATVLSWRRPPRRHPEHPMARLDLRLRVQPPEGEPYEAVAIWRADAELLPQLAPGSQVSVKIDRDDPTRIYPNMTGVEPWHVHPPRPKE